MNKATLEWTHEMNKILINTLPIMCKFVRKIIRNFKQTT